jgi:hypothetical protein
MATVATLLVLPAAFALLASGSRRAVSLLADDTQRGGA